MAKQDGIIPIKGTIDNITFLKTKDGYIARKKGSVDPEKLAKSPNYARTREAMANFKKATSAGTLLRTALKSLIKNASDHRTVSRLATRMLEVIKADKTNPRGKKNVIDGETELLTGFEFNANGKLSATFSATYEASIDRATGTAQVKIAPFIPQNMVSAPGGATHFQLHVAGVEADFEQGRHAEQVKSTDHLALGEAEQPAIDLSVALPAASTHPLFLAMAITFSTEDLGTKYPLKNGAYNALAIVKVSGV